MKPEQLELRQREMRERKPTPSSRKGMKYHCNRVVAYHGTSHENAKLILENGFNAGTYFAYKMEDAARFGGPVILKVHLSASKDMWHGEPDGWQFHTRNHLPSIIIVDVYCCVVSAEPKWSQSERDNFGKLASAPQPEPTEHLIRAMGDRARNSVRGEGEPHGD